MQCLLDSSTFLHDEEYRIRVSTEKVGIILQYFTESEFSLIPFMLVILTRLRLSFYILSHSVSVSMISFDLLNSS